MAALESRLQAAGVSCRRLETTHAFHSRMMEPIVPRLTELLRKIPFQEPQIPLISNLTGTWMTPGEARDPEYWTRHLRQAVRFGAGMEEIWREPARLLLEVGPGQALATLAMQHPSAAGAQAPVLRAMRHQHEHRADSAALIETLGRLWLAGAKVDWQGLRGEAQRRRLPLPTYPFERKRFFIESRRNRPAAASVPSGAQGPEAAPVAAPVSTTGSALGLHDRPNLKHAYVEPRNDVEREIAGIWRHLLGIREVGAHDSFFELGGNSLIAPQLVLALRERLRVDLPLAALFDVPTVAEMAEAVELIRAEGSAAAVLTRKPVDLRAEVVLPPEIAAGNLPRADGLHPQAIVLTGATGFLGAHLVRDLLEMTGARLYCPARAGSAAEAGQRIRRNLESRMIWKDEYEARIVPLAADLGLPLWGLSEAEFDHLAQVADAIYHGGAWVNFTYPYHVLKDINVGGTVEALRLASRHKVKPVHFISSVAAISPRIFRDGGAAYEDSDLQETVGLFGGYGESKWVGEKIVELARSRGIPAAVYRPGVVSGDSLTGASNTRDMVWNLMKGCIQLGTAPERAFLIDVAPVDYVSRAIVHLSLRPDTVGHAFHFPSSTPMRWAEALPILRAYGYPLETVSQLDWVRKVAEVVPRSPDNALLPFLPILVPPEVLRGEQVPVAEMPPEAPSGPPMEPRYDQSNTLAGLAGSGIACPPLDDRLLGIYLDYFVRTGWLPPPPGV